jgi:hypothetical protein
LIWESWPWKRELERTAKEFSRRRTQRRWPEASLARVERNLFVAAYSIRKLLEAQKLSDQVTEMRISCSVFRPTGRTVDMLNWHRLEELYCLHSPEKKDVSLRDFCNCLIHSFVFVVDTRDGFTGAYVTSDDFRTKRLFYFDTETIVRVLESVADDDVVHSRMVRDPETGEAKYTRKSNRYDQEQ